MSDPREGTALESITGIWRQVLDREDLGPDDNFFDAGGDSLALMRVHIRLQDLIGQDFPLIELYDQATIREMASFISEVGNGARRY